MMMWIVSIVCVVGGERDASVRESLFYMRRVTWAEREFIFADWDWSRLDRDHELEFVTFYFPILNFVAIWDIAKVIPFDSKFFTFSRLSELGPGRSGVETTRLSFPSVSLILSNTPSGIVPSKAQSSHLHASRLLLVRLCCLDLISGLSVGWRCVGLHMFEVFGMYQSKWLC